MNKKVLIGFILATVALLIIGAFVFLNPQKIIDEAKGRRATSSAEMKKEAPPEAPVQAPSSAIVTEQTKEGEMTSVLPNEVAAAQVKPVREVAPPIQVNTPGTAERGIGPELARNIATTPVPQGLTEQRPLGAGGGSVTYDGAAVSTARKRYLFRNMSPTALEMAQGQGEGSGSDNINPATFAPQTTEIEATVVNPVFTTNSEMYILASVCQRTEFGGHLILNEGDRIVGAISSKWQNRVMGKFKRVILKSGKSFPINGLALSADRTEGIEGYRVSDLAKQLILPVLFEGGSSFLKALASDGTTQTQSEFGNFSTQTDNGVGDKADRSGKQAGASVTQKISDIISQDMEEYKPWVYVPAGVRFKIALLDWIDVSQADYGK